MQRGSYMRTHQHERMMSRRGPASSSTSSPESFRASRSSLRQVPRVETLLGLQRTHGNAFVQRLMQQTASERPIRQRLRDLPTEKASRQHVWPCARRHHTEPECESTVQKDAFGTGGRAMGTYVARPGDSLSLIAGYPNSGWEERLDQLIAANPDHPNIRNRTPDDPQFGWLEIGDVINIPWTMSGTPTPSAPSPSPSTSTPAAPGATAPAPTGGKSRCSVVIAGGTKIGITKLFELTATASPHAGRGSYGWVISNPNLTIEGANNQSSCRFRAGTTNESRRSA